jgi:hypothetical protein
MKTVVIRKKKLKIKKKLTSSSCLEPVLLLLPPLLLPLPSLLLLLPSRFEVQNGPKIIISVVKK